MDKLVPEQNVRSALHYLIHSLIDLHNHYGAAGAWRGLPVPLEDIAKRLEVAEGILEDGSERTLAKLKNDVKI